MSRVKMMIMGFWATYNHMLGTCELSNVGA